MGKIRAVEALVALGADLKAKDSEGLTPIEAAERAGLSDITVVLKRALSQ